MRHKIVIIEDDELIRNMIKFKLVKNGYEVSCFSSAESMLISEKQPYDLLILDILLPGISGVDLLKKLRSQEDNTPVIMLTVKKDVPSKVSALYGGADGYIVKPFNMDELLARVEALIRRSQGKRSVPAGKFLVINGCEINTSTRLCDSKRGKVLLSEKEIRLLLFFSEHSNETLSRADILEEVWGMDVAPSLRTIDNFILKFRKLFEDNSEEPKHFLSVRGKGYRFEA